MAQGSSKKIVFAVGLGAVVLVVALVMYTSGSDSSTPAPNQSRRVVEDANDLDETNAVAERQRGTGGEGAGSTRLAADSSDQSETDEAEGEAEQTKKRKNTKPNKKRRKSGDAGAGEEEEAAAPPKKVSRRPIKAP